MVMALRKIQFAKETTRGTPVVTGMDLLLGRLTMTPTLTLYTPEDEERNSLALLHRRSIVGQQAALKYDGSVSFEQIINFLAMGLIGGVTPTIPGGGVLSRDWTFEPTLIALAAPDAFTFQYGDNQQAYQTVFAMASQLEFTYAIGEPVVLSAELFGRFPTKVTFGAAPTTVTIEDAISQKTVLTSAATWAGIPGAVVSNTLISAVIRIPTGMTPVRFADGLLEFSDFHEQKWAADVELVFRHNASGVAEYDKYTDDGHRFFRLETTGTLIEGVLNKLFRLDLAMRYTEAPELLGEQDGLDVIRLSGRTFLDPTGGRQLRALVRNTQTALA